MQQAIPYRSWRIDLHTRITTPPPHSFTNSAELTESSRDNNNNQKKKNNKMVVVERMVLENAVIVFGRRGCCMSHVVNRLLLGLGVNPLVHELEEDDHDDEGYFRNRNNNNNNKVQFPAVFIGGKFFGGLDRIMATHISGELVPILKQAGALWL
ncbi:Glutaredoxin-C9 [Stylosanthes scabra]|uniref:Glutaredoxin-C9 n=1 Tax=Stylosanthes scabra TaxID=79078 RepID=A0ABU6VIX1_9FABA|nr:Glutaredoxin-C9 [Stylosanthes scabra]